MRTKMRAPMTLLTIFAKADNFKFCTVTRIIITKMHKTMYGL
jgi:hypothetical protein